MASEEARLQPVALDLRALWKSKVHARWEPDISLLSDFATDTSASQARATTHPCQSVTNAGLTKYRPCLNTYLFKLCCFRFESLISQAALLRILMFLCNNSLELCIAFCFCLAKLLSRRFQIDVVLCQRCILPRKVLITLNCCLRNLIAYNARTLVLRHISWSSVRRMPADVVPMRAKVSPPPLTTRGNRIATKSNGGCLVGNWVGRINVSGCHAVYCLIGYSQNHAEYVRRQEGLSIRDFDIMFVTASLNAAQGCVSPLYARSREAKRAARASTV